MGRAYAEDTVDGARLALDDDAFGGKGGHGDTAERTHIEEAVVVDVLHHEADLVAVAFDHHPQWRVRVDAGAQVAVDVDRQVGNGGGLEVVGQQRHAVVLETGRGGGRNKVF